MPYFYSTHYVALLLISRHNIHNTKKFMLSAANVTEQRHL